MFCMNCGKQIPDGQGTLCAECAAQMVYQAQPAQAQAGTPYMPQQAPAGTPYIPQQAPHSGKHAAGKSSKKWIPIAGAIAVVVVLAIIIGFAAAANTASAKFARGLGQLFNTGDEYTVLSMFKNVCGETAALFDDGKNVVTFDAAIPYSGDVSGEATIAKKGAKTEMEFTVDSDYFELESTGLYIDEGKAVVTIPDVGSYGVLLSDIGDSLEANDIMDKSEFESLIKDAFNILKDLNGTVEELSEELEKIAYDAIPKGCLSKDSDKFNGEKCATVVLSMNDEESSQFMISFLRGIQDSKLIMDYVQSYFEAMSIEDSYYEDYDIAEDIEEAIEYYEDEVLWNNFEFVLYFDGKTLVGMTLDIEGTNGYEGEDITAEYTIEKNKDETIRDFYFADMYNDDEESSVRLVSTWSGSKNDSTDLCDITYYDGYDEYTYALELDHTVKGGEITDTLESDIDVGFVDVTHTLDGKIGGSFTASISFASDATGAYGEAIEFELGIDHDKSAGSVSAPKYTCLSDGSDEYFDQDALDDFLDDIYDSPLGELFPY